MTPRYMNTARRHYSPPAGYRWLGENTRCGSGKQHFLITVILFSVILLRVILSAFLALRRPLHPLTILETIQYWLEQSHPDSAPARWLLVSAPIFRTTSTFESESGRGARGLVDPQQTISKGLRLRTVQVPGVPFLWSVKLGERRR